MGFLKNSSAEVPVPNYDYITTNKGVDEALDYLSNFNVIEVDTEGTSLSPFDGKTTLLQIGVPGKAFVIDVRNDTEFSEVSLSRFKPLLTDVNVLKILQNANYDMKMIKYHYGFYLENIYDTMLAEQLINLGRFSKASLDFLVTKYLSLTMNKEPRGTFQEYDKKFELYQLDYAATDVCIMSLIRDMQLVDIEKYGLEKVCALEFKFVKPMCEMELNGVKIDVPKWRMIMAGVSVEALNQRTKIEKDLSTTQEQTTLFGVSTVNLNSPLQLKSALNKYGLSLESTSKDELEKYESIPVISNLLKYRKLEKLVSTYSESLLAKIHPKTGRLHTSFKQLISTGRLSSAHPNLQNIPGLQKYRSCFIAEEGKSLVTADMSGAELRILGNLSQDEVFVSCYNNGIDVHTKSASGVFGVPYDKVTKEQRKASKAITFGLAYGLSKVGLSRRLKISTTKAAKLMDNYFKMFPQIKAWLDAIADEAVRKGYSETVLGRKRFYDVPKYDSEERGRVINSIKRKAKNAPIQGANADTIKQAMIILLDRLDKLDYYAKLILTVHDELIVECSYDKRYEVATILENSIKDGFDMYFDTIKMETDGLISPCWMKGSCDAKRDGKKCGSLEFEFIPDDKYITKLICKKCGAVY